MGLDYLSSLINLLPLIAFVFILFFVFQFFFFKLEKKLKLTNRTLRYNVFISSLIFVFELILFLLINFYFDFIIWVFICGLTIIIVLFLKIIVPVKEKTQFNHKNNSNKIITYERSKIIYFIFGIPVFLIGCILLNAEHFINIDILFLVAIAVYLIIEMVNGLLNPMVVINDNLLKYNISIFLDAEILLEDITDIEVEKNFLKKKCVNIFCYPKDCNLKGENGTKNKIKIFPLKNTEEFVEILIQHIENVKNNN